MTLLLVCLLATTFMAGLSWFVGGVHYPLFGAVGAPGWAEYHRRHSDRTTLVVVAPMLAHLVTAGLLVVDRPAGMGSAAALAGLALALGTWVLTAIAARRHAHLSGGFDPAVGRRLLAAHHARTALWSAHAVLLAVVVERVAA